MATYVYTEEVDLLPLILAMSDPAKEVWFKGRKQTNRSVAELMVMIEYVQDQLNAQAGTGIRVVEVIQE